MTLWGTWYIIPAENEGTFPRKSKRNWACEWLLAAGRSARYFSPRCANCELYTLVKVRVRFRCISNILCYSPPRHPRITRWLRFSERRINSGTRPRMAARYEWRKNTERGLVYIPYLYRNCEMHRSTLKLNLFSLRRYRCISLRKT